LLVLPNQGYKGHVALSVLATPAVAGLKARLEPAAVDVAGQAESALRVAWPGATPVRPVALAVTGTDTNGRSTSLCVQLGPPKSGQIQVVSTLAPPAKTRKNIEIILDASGSMKTLMGKQSRWDVALETLQQVLAKLPDDFNVGLRMYGHREPSTSFPATGDPTKPNQAG
jgi:hypothetical protein